MKTERIEAGWYSIKGHPTVNIIKRDGSWFWFDSADSSVVGDPKWTKAEALRGAVRYISEPAPVA